ncbi:hypothetical protein ACVW0J_000458 [Bradyrhizobium sp. i1.7.7]
MPPTDIVPVAAVVRIESAPMLSAPDIVSELWTITFGGGPPKSFIVSDLA